MNYKAVSTIIAAITCAFGQVLFSFNIAQAASPPSQVALYSLYEISVVNSTNYTNPFDYEEVTLSAEIVSPSGRIFRVLGFFDGDGLGGSNGDIWKWRFMPDELGAWTYHYSWSDGTSGADGNFLVIPQSNNLIKGHVRVDPQNPRYLIHDDGTPHYFWGSKWFSTTNMGPQSKGGEVNTDYISDQQINNFITVLRNHRHNGVGMKVALYTLENDKISWDLSWTKRIESVVHSLAGAGIYTTFGFFDTWSRGPNSWFDAPVHGDDHIFNAWEAGDEHAKRNYIRTIVARFSSFYNVYWELVNEGEHSNSASAFNAQANSKYLPWIRDADPYDLPLGASEDDIWSGADVEAAYLHQTNLSELPQTNWTWPAIINELVRGGIDGEPLWDDAVIRDDRYRLGYRRSFWRMFTHGGSGTSEATWLDLTRSLNQAVLNVMGDQRRFREFIEGIPVSINTMNPATSFVISGISGSDFRTRAKSGEVYVTYFHLGLNSCVSSSQISVNLPTGQFDYMWFNPSSGQFTSAGEINAGSGNEAIPYQAFCEDGVLLVTKSGGSPPTPTTTPTVTNTSTYTPTKTPTRIPTSTPTKTPMPTATSTATATYTATRTPTRTPQASLTPTPTRTVMPSSTSTRTVTPTFTASHTPTIAPSNTATKTPTATKTSIPTYTPINPSQQSVVKLSLIDADRDVVIAGFEDLTDGAVINLRTLPTRNLNILAITDPEIVGSVRFEFDGSLDYRIESVAPYALASDRDGDYRAMEFPIGQHNLTVIPYTETSGQGAEGKALSINFEVVNQEILTPTPLPSPTFTPTPTPTQDYNPEGVGTPACTDQLDSDFDGVPDCQDRCPADRFKSVAGICGCGRFDTDYDLNGTMDCEEVGLTRPLKSSRPGIARTEPFIGKTLVILEPFGDGTSYSLLVQGTHPSTGRKQKRARTRSQQILEHNAVALDLKCGDYRLRYQVQGEIIKSTKTKMVKSRKSKRLRIKIC
ncbi:MAG: DUF5060 domain-containing protein [Bdellovibrionales bacterium]|nr:DUF5060 domain-containing protein [Bdellovibrionales bacterium]